MAGDRNFDDLAHRFAANIHASTKGEIRQAVLKRDFESVLLPQLICSDKPVRVLDAGGGQGQMTVFFAERGFEVVLCDVSVEMLKQAKASIDAQGLSAQVTFYHGSIQQYLHTNPQPFDLILCHALLEWLEEAEPVLTSLCDALTPEGWLSLLYYNLHGLVFKNLLRTNFKKIRTQKWQGSKRSLTPSNPLTPEQVNVWVAKLPLSIECESGVRVFNDYVFSRADRERQPETLLRYELDYSRRKPYQQLARYMHLLLRKQ